MIIILSGAMNSGKTATGIELANNIPNAKFIDVDWIFGEKETYEMEEKYSFKEFCQMRFNKMIEMANGASENETLVLAYVVFEDGYNQIKKKLDKGFHVFVLNPGIEWSQKEKGDRTLNEWELNRIKELYDMGIAKLPQATAVIDNSDKTIEETAKKIMGSL